MIRWIGIVALAVVLAPVVIVFISAVTLWLTYSIIEWLTRNG